MKKKLWTLAIVTIMALCMVACSAAPAAPAAEAPAAEEPTAPATEEAAAPAAEEATGAEKWGPAENTWLYGLTSNLLNGEHPFYQAALYFDEALREKTNNKYGLEIYVGGQLGNDAEMVEGVLAGTYQFGMNSSGLFANIDPELNIFDLPYLFSSNEHAYAVLDGEIGQKALDSLDQYGLVGLGFAESGFRNITSSFQINSPADMKGMKLRTMDVPMHLEYFNLLGANATPMAMTEVYTSLQQGTIDGHENLNMGILSNRIYEVNKFITVSEHIYTPILLTMNAEYFNSLPAEDQQAIREAATESIARQRVEAQRQNNNALKIMEESNGVTVTRVDKAPFMAVADELYAAHPEYKELIEQVRSLDPAN